jgi:thiol:disulfide interchange protein DsbA
MTAFRILATLLVALFAVPAQSQVEGQDYQTLRTPQAPSSADKIEILEFFSFRCPHCAAFHPLLSQWEQELPANAVLVRVPVSFGRRDWGLLSRAYYA